MKRMKSGILAVLAALIFSGCTSTKKVFDMKDKSLSAPTQNAVRMCNLLTWIYNTSEDYEDMRQMLNEIGVTRESLETLTFNDAYEKPFGHKFDMGTNEGDDNITYRKARNQARKIAGRIIKNCYADESVSDGSGEPQVEPAPESETTMKE